MANTLRNIALQIAIPVVAVLVGVNAYVITSNLMRIQEATSRRVDAAVLQADISNVLLDLDDMETSQRGYLLTGDASYLGPYTDGQRRLSAHLPRLHSRFAGNASAQERSIAAQLESVAQAKIAEMDETIRLRQQGYRHRAFLLVSSNTGRELMDDARAKLNALLLTQTNNLARFDGELRQRVRTAYTQAALANCAVLLITIITLVAFNTYSKHLQRQGAQRSEQLRATSAQLERLTSLVSRDFRALVTNTGTHANSLLELYGGFLPRQGQEQAERIEHGSRQMNRLLDDMFREPLPGVAAKLKDIPEAKKLTA